MSEKILQGQRVGDGSRFHWNPLGWDVVD